MTTWFPVIIVGLVMGLFVYFWQFAPASSGVTVFAVGTVPAVTFERSPSALPTPIVAGATPIVLDSLSAPFNAPEEGQPAPDFTLLALDGGEVSLSDFRGQPVLINFWASWCPPCRLEMPDLIRAYETHQEEGFVILGINQTFQDSIADAEAFVDEFHITFPILLDLNGEVTNWLYQLRGLPMSVFVDKDGVINRIHIGLMTAEQIDEYVDEILK